MQDNNGTLRLRLRANVGHAISTAGATIEEDLRSGDSKIERLRTAGHGGVLLDVDAEDRQTFGVLLDAHGISGVHKGHVAQPRVDNVVHIDPVELPIDAVRDAAIGSAYLEVLDTYAGNASCDKDAGD